MMSWICRAVWQVEECPGALPKALVPQGRTTDLSSSFSPVSNARKMERAGVQNCFICFLMCLHMFPFNPDFIFSSAFIFAGNTIKWHLNFMLKVET